MIWREMKPPFPNVDEDTEMEIALKQAFTAMSLALRRGHHPKLWKRVQGSPYEQEYRRLFFRPEFPTAAHKG